MRTYLVFMLSCILALNLWSQDTLSDYHNIAFGNKDQERKANINIGLSGDIKNLQGTQANIFSSVVRQKTKGWNGALFMALTVKDMSGLQSAFVTNVVGGKTIGMQYSVLTNATKGLYGLQLSVMNNLCGSDFSGSQISFISNISKGIAFGCQVSAFMNICASKSNGVQVSMYNYADSLDGVQVGVVNFSPVHSKGVQIGLVNYTADNTKRKYGLVNISPYTNIQFMSFVGTSSKINLAARFRNQNTYNIIGFATHYEGLMEDFSGALFYRLGYWKWIKGKWDCSADLGYYHIMSTDSERSAANNNFYSIQAHCNLDYKFRDYLTFFASVGYEYTRYYSKNEVYHNRPLLEIGTILF